MFFYPVVFAFFLGCSVAWLNFIYFFTREYLSELDWAQIQNTVPVLLAAATVLMLIVVFWTLNVSNQFFGPYERILRELDAVLDGNKTGPITVRKRDEFFSSLLKRVNVLIERQS